MSNDLTLNEMIASAFQAIIEQLQAATELVGLDCLWARATPVINSEDVVLQEYTLTNVGLECPKNLRVICNNTDYNPGNYTIDLFGLNYEQPLEISITIQEWQNQFGKDTMPLKDDIVYIKIYNKLFEVKTSQVVYTVASMPTYFKCTLSKYSPTASRKETEEFKESVDELTISQEELFGDIISQEVADNNADVETSYNNTTYVDPLKEYDIDSIQVSLVFGSSMNLISNAYYNFKIALKNICYHTDLIYECSAERNHLVYSCWCNTDNSEILQAKVTGFKFHSKDSNYWYFIIGTPLQLNIGDDVTLTRGTLLKIPGTIVLINCEDNIGIAIKNSNMSKANKKLTNWYNTFNMLKVYKESSINLLKGYDENDKTVLDLTYKGNSLNITVNNVVKSKNIDLSFTNWHYFMFDICPSNIHVIVYKVGYKDMNKMEDFLCADINIPIELTDFHVELFCIENMGCNVYMCNIRLYENEYEASEDVIALDMYSPVTRNASKLILVDSPNVPNKDIFVSPIK